MNRTPRTTRTRANALTNPTPLRVSLCRAGANQEPIRTKSDGSPIDQEELADMLTKMKAQGYEVQSFRFKGEKWTEEAVQTYLTAGGYTEAEITPVEGGFTVADKGEGEIEGFTYREIETEDGVTVVLAKEEAEEAAAEVQPVAKDDISDADLDKAGKTNPQQGKKFKKKPPQGNSGNATDAQDTAAKEDGGTEVIEPVTGDVDVVALVAALKSAKGLPETAKKGFYEISQLADLVRSLKWMCSDAAYAAIYSEAFGTDGDDAVAAKATLEAMQNAGGWLLVALAAMVNDELDEMAEVFGTAAAEPPTKTEGEEPVTEEPVVEAEPEAEPVVEEPAAEVEPEAEPVAEVTEEPTPVAKTEDAPPAWFSSAMEAITTSVQTLTGKVEGVAERQAALEERTKEAAPAASQVRKSAVQDVELTFGTPEKQTEDSAFIAGLRLRGSLGI